ncbi:MAG: winged helix-turn-helix transcriptional regulator [Firmicutes bacterium]|nr:winged helix-turn-helix transcriptional regulator [Bacillota bacterium]
MINELEKFFKALGEPTRLRIIKLLAERELCVCELVEVLQISQPRISQHLRVLKNAGLVSERKEQQWSISALHFENLGKMLSMFNELLSKPLELLDEFKAEAPRMRLVTNASSAENCKNWRNSNKIIRKKQEVANG